MKPACHAGPGAASRGHAGGPACRGCGNAGTRAPSADGRFSWARAGTPATVSSDIQILVCQVTTLQKGRNVMPTAEAAPPLAGPLDEQLTARLLQQRVIVLGAEVEDRIASRLCAQLLLLSAEDPRRDISLYINSPGGTVSAGLAIYDTMRLIPNDVSTLALGLAGSMAQFLLCAGTAGKRYSLPHAQILMHQGSAGFGGTAADVEI